MQRALALPAIDNGLRMVPLPQLQVMPEGQTACTVLIADTKPFFFHPARKHYPFGVSYNFWLVCTLEWDHFNIIFEGAWHTKTGVVFSAIISLEGVRGISGWKRCKLA